MHASNEHNTGSQQPPRGGPRVFFAQGFPGGFPGGMGGTGGPNPFGASQQVWSRFRTRRERMNPLQRFGDTLLKGLLLILLLVLGAVGLVLFLLLAAGVLVFLGLRSAWRSLLAGAKRPGSNGGRENVRVMTRR